MARGNSGELHLRQREIVIVSTIFTITRHHYPSVEYQSSVVRPSRPRLARPRSARRGPRQDQRPARLADRIDRAPGPARLGVAPPRSAAGSAGSGGPGLGRRPHVIPGGPKPHEETFMGAEI